MDDGGDVHNFLSISTGFGLCLVGHLEERLSFQKIEATSISFVNPSVL